MENLSRQGKLEIIEMIIDHLYSIEEFTCEHDLHNDIFNTDYFIVGYAKANKWLVDNVGVFNAIKKVHEYEMDQFGELYTELYEPEQVCNMYVYIVAYKIWVSVNFNEYENVELNNNIIKEIEEGLKGCL